MYMIHTKKTRNITANTIMGLLSLVCGLALLAGHLTISPKAEAAVAPSGVCGNPSTNNPIDTIVVISEENRTWSGGASPAVSLGFSPTKMPYLNSLSNQCTYFTNMSETNKSQNSATQYVGAWTGYNETVTHVANDCSPSSSCSYTGNNIFRVFRNAGIPHREYVEGATTACSASGNAAKHVPQLYMWDPVDKAACANEVLPLSQFSFAAPPKGFTFITPTMCNDGHDCSDSTVDNWLADSSRLPALFNSQAYKEGRVLVEIWYDEDLQKPNLFMCQTCGHNVVSTDPTYAAESLLWLNLLGAPSANLGAISTATDIRPIVLGNTTPVDNPPTVTLTAPAAGASIAVGSRVTLSANATDDKAVSKVSFFLDNSNTPLATATTSPYSYSWDTTAIPAGGHTIKAIAYDSANQPSTTAQVNITLTSGTSCSPAPSNSLGSMVSSVTIPSGTGSTYHVWSRVKAPDSSNNSYYLLIDGCTLINVGDSASLPADNTWYWINYKDGNTSSFSDVNLTAGTHTLTMIGREPNVQLDRLMFVSDSCVPTGMGDNCTSTADVTAPSVSITTPSNGANITTSSQSISATSTDNAGGTGVAKVDLFYNSTNLIGSVTTQANNTYQVNWDTTKVPSNASYSLTAVATDKAGNSTTSAPVTVNVKLPDTAAPTIPTNLRTTNVTYNKVDLAWNASTDTGGAGLAGYRIYQNGVQIGTTTSTSFSDTTHVASNYAGASYTYSVDAYDKATPPNSSAVTSITVPIPPTPDTTPPSAPSNLTVTGNVYNKVSLSWSASTDNSGGSGMNGYYVRRNGIVVSPLITTTSYQDTAITAGQTYQYDIIAVDKSLNPSGPSNVQTVKVPNPPDTTAPGVPGDFMYTIVASQISLSWTASTDNAGGTGVASYDVYRNGTLYANVSTTSFADAVVSPGVTYSYYVKARDGAGNTSTATATLQASVPAPTPVTISIDPTDDSVLSKTNPNAKNGLNTSMTVDSDPVKDLLYKFTVSGVGNKTVTSAKLRVWNNNGSDIGGVFWAAANNDWNEASVNWNNAPAATTRKVGSLPKVTRYHYYDVDLSNYITSDGVYSVRVTTTSLDPAGYASRNAKNVSRRPVLTVTAQ